MKIFPVLRALNSPALLLIALIFTLHFRACADEITIDIPKVAAPVTDSAWVNGAYHADVLKPSNDNDGAHAALALGWNEKGLLIHVDTDDSTPVEAGEEKALWMGDSTEVYVGSATTEGDYFQLVFSPGRMPAHDQPRFFMNDKRKKPPAFAKPEIQVVEKSTKGYAMSVLIPWSNFTTPPSAGDIIRLQVHANDAVAVAHIFRRVWFPKPNYANTTNTYRVRLATTASPAQKAVALTSVDRHWNTQLRVLATADMAGKNVEIGMDGNRTNAGTLVAGGPDGSELTFTLPAEIAAKKSAKLQVLVAGEILPPELGIPDPVEKRKNLLSKCFVKAQHPVFDGEVFPSIDFANNDTVDIVFGPYKLDIRYFDAGWNEVAFPSKPGRYGALVTIHTSDGLTDTRRVTLFKTPKKYFERSNPYGVRLDFPGSFGLPADIAKRDATPIEDIANRQIADSDTNPAVVAAGLNDVAANPAQNLGFDLWTLDNEWWTGLDRKLGQHSIYKYQVYLPEGYEKDANKPWPLIICLHGSGERGSDLKAVTKNGLPKKMEAGMKLPCIVVAPLCPEGGWWCPSTLIEVLDEVESKYRVDAKRVYLTGLSMGGYGTWDAAVRYPERFAAIAPICGGAAPELAPRLAKMPVWAFHGSDDSAVPIWKDQRIIDALKKLKAPVKFTVYPGVEHDSWTQTYDNPALYEWLLQHSLLNNGRLSIEPQARR